MAVTRQVVQDPNAPNRGAAPSQQFAVGGIQTPSGAPRRVDTGLTGALDAFGRIGEALVQKQQTSDFLAGQMASMAGKTQDEVAATGNRTTMAGFVGLEVHNAVQEWATAETKAAAAQHHQTDPAEYGAVLSASASELISKVGDDTYAQEVLAKNLAPAMQRLAASQAASHQQFVMKETANSYESGLVLAARAAASNFAGADTNPQGPVTGAQNGFEGDYRAFAASFVNKIGGVESNGRADAQNPNSTARGWGQFIDKTWLSMIRRYRPDLAGDKTDAEIIALKDDPILSKEMTIAYGAENARGLDQAGLPVTQGTTYLAHFAGLGGAKRVLRGDPNAPVSTTLTKDQIDANKTVVYRNGELITNAEMVAWAEKKMGGKFAPTPTGVVASPTPEVQEAVLANPGLPVDVHRTSVVNAVITTLQAGDGSLFQTAGGVEGLSGALNLSAAQISQIRTAHKAFTQKRQTEYNQNYERHKHNLLQDAASGKFTEAEMFAKMNTLHAAYDRSPEEQQRVHLAMQKTMTAADRADMDSAWQDADAQLAVIDLKNMVLDGEIDAAEAADRVKEIGEVLGASEEATAKAVGVITGAYDAMRTNERAEIARAVKAGEKTLEVQNSAALLLSQGILGTGSEAEQAAGVRLMEETLVADLEAMEIPMEQRAAVASDMFAKALVTNNVIDKRRAEMMRAAMHAPLDKDGKPTDKAIQAFAFFLDLKEGAGAPPEYLAKMFNGNERTLELMMTAQEHLVGDADLDMAISKAFQQINDPVSAARIADRQKRISTGELQERAKALILEDSGLMDTFWNNTMNLFNPSWEFDKLEPEQVDRIMSDTGINLVVEEEIRSAVALMPNASDETIARIVSSQMAERGEVLGGSFVIAPKGKTIRGMMGLNSTENDAPFKAVDAYIAANGKEMFGEAVWDDLKSGLMSYVGEGSFSGGDTPEYTVELIGDNMVIRPTAARYAYDDDALFDDYTTLPEAAVAVIPAAEIGAFYNKHQTKSRFSLTNSIADMFGG